MHSSPRQAFEARVDIPIQIGRRARFRRPWHARLSRLWSSFRVSIDPRTPIEAQLVDAQINMVRDAARPSIYVIPLASILIAWVGSTWVGWRGPVLWGAAMVTGCIAGEAVNRWVERKGGTLPPDVARRARVYTATSLILAAVWGAMPAAIWAPGVPINHMLIILILASTLAGWSAIGAPHLASGRLPLFCFATSMILSPLFAGGWLNFAVAGMCGGYTILIVTLARTTYETSYKMLRLQFERRGLISNLRRAKEESDCARIRAEAASLAKSQFLANMSHELRTPMNAILGFSELISTKAFGSSIDKYAEYAEIIHSSGQHLLALINDILDLAKIEAGRMELDESNVDVSTLIAECVLMMTRKAEEGGIALSTDIRPRLPFVHGDERALRQILVNLLSNAVKFTQAKGSVVVFARVDADGRLALGVEDNGVGIEEDDQSRVFESFGQGRHDIAIFEKGTGLGLPIVKGLAEVHGAEVTLVSQRSVGTCVTIYFPSSRLRNRPHVEMISTGCPSVARGGWGA